MIKINKVLLILIGSVFLFSCGSEEPITPVQPEVKIEHTLFVYMGNLPSYIMDGDIEDMLVGLNASKPNGNVIIFYDQNFSDTELIELKPNSEGVYSRVVLKNYGENLDTSDLNVFKLALSDLKEFTSSKGYSMILSSHGSGWVTSEMMSGSSPMRRSMQELNYSPNPLTRAIVDAGSYAAGMDIHDVAEAIPDGMFDFVLFDACNMGCVEIVYALKDKVDFVVASPSEVLIDGFPYHAIIEDLFDKSSVVDALNEVCVKYFNTYKYHEGGCNIALYDCSKIDAVASLFSEVVDRAFNNNIIPNTSNLQWFDGPISPHLMYDMLEFSESWIRGSDQLLVSLAASLNEMIVYAKTSNTSDLGYDFFRSPVTAYCGVSIYVPQRLEYTNRYYMSTDWAKQVYGENDISTIFN